MRPEPKTAGYPLQFEWFAPHFEFRFPVYGRIQQRDITVELRQAIEPWNVLGEEPGGTAAPCVTLIPPSNACKSKSPR